MSAGSSAARDPVLDEAEDDWVQMKIIEGWSHGYLQMLSLLPEAEHAINMMADWIETAFEKHEEKSRPEQRQLAPPPLRKTVSSPDTVTPNNEEADVEDAEDVLSFTPRKRSGTLSPAIAPVGAARVALVPNTASDDSVSTALPLTPPELSLSTPPVLNLNAPSESLSPTKPKHPLAHERLLREELSSLAAPSIGRRSVSLEPQLTGHGQHGRRSASDDDSLLSAGSDGRPAVPKPRTGSAGQLPTPPANFVEAKDLLKRRRDVAVFGLSNTNSAVGSDDEGSGEGAGTERVARDSAVAREPVV